MTPFFDRLAESAARLAPACVGLDPRPEHFPKDLRAPLVGLTGADWRLATAHAAAAWSRLVIEAVAGEVPAVKPQAAFYEALGSVGVAALEATITAARDAGLLVILDAKRGDIGSTAEAYAAATLDDDGPMGADAVTLSPWLGPESVQPFLNRCDASGKGLFLLLRTSNPGSRALQTREGASTVATWVREWNESRDGAFGYGPVGVVVGGTLDPVEIAHWRGVVPNAWFLVPGYGAQGATASDIRACFDARGGGALVTSSRGITSPSEDDATRFDHDPISVIRSNARAFTADLRSGF